MKTPFAFVLAAAALLPFAAAPVSAQTPPDGPPPAVRAQFEQLHATAKTNAFNALSADHRARVEAIIAQVNAGTIDRQAAAQQIDAILTPSEAQAVLAEQKKMRDAMRTYFAQNAPPGQSGMGGGQSMHRRTPDAGRTLLMLGANRPQRPPGRP